jgi:hypothetical protein
MLIPGFMLTIMLLLVKFQWNWGVTARPEGRLSRIKYCDINMVIESHGTPRILLEYTTIREMDPEHAANMICNEENS